MDDIISQYVLRLDEYDREIKNTETKAHKAMRITLWLKIILSIATVAAVGSWLKGHGAKEVWAFIIVLAELADAMMNTLPFADQKSRLPQLKIKLVDIYFEMERDLIRLKQGDITEAEAIDRFYNHQNTWAKALA